MLPAIQREFIWKIPQICRLFDSLMQGFPINSFLFWKIEKETAAKFCFFEFVLKYHQRDNPHCQPLGKAPDGTVTAVLDGQQRLTSLNIGLRGSMAVKEPNKWWNNPNAFPVKRLYLDLLHTPKPDEEGEIYRFAFLTEEHTKKASEGEHWFPVSKVLELEEMHDLMGYLAGAELGNEKRATATLGRLHKVVWVYPTITFYEEESQDIEKVLAIFIRTNSGGTVLSYSDLLLSIATAQWSEVDARSEIHRVVDELNETGKGFDLSKDFVLKAGLMLSDIASVGFKVENFIRPNMAVLEARWTKVAAALRLTVRLAADFGLSRDTIRADSALLPIAYYLYRKGATDTYLGSPAMRSDRAAIRQWLVRSLLKPGIWGSGLDTLLTALRDVLRAHEEGGFPVSTLAQEMNVRGKTLAFTDEEIQDLADVKYGSRDALIVLSILFPFVDPRNNIHIDHLMPRAQFHATKLRRAGFSEEEVESLHDRKERLANLILLEGQENQSKGDQMPGEWITGLPEAERQQFLSRHFLGQLPDDIRGFDSLYEARRERLLQKLKEELSDDWAAANFG